jgi:hypothetical protein
MALRSFSSCFRRRLASRMAAMSSMLVVSTGRGKEFPLVQSILMPLAVPPCSQTWDPRHQSSAILTPRSTLSACLPVCF